MQSNSLDDFFQRVLASIHATSLEAKRNAIDVLFDLLASLEAEWSDISWCNAVSDILQPGFPPDVVLVHPHKLKNRGLGSVTGRARFLHAIAHIEFNAINLALDAVYRFRGLPISYYTEWLRVASDEARHHQMLLNRLQDMGHKYGDFPAHNGLWDAAVNSAGSLKVRMAIVPCVFEARGLDVTPAMIERLQAVDDHDSARVLEVILEEEVEHVAIGNHWFRYACAQEGVDADLELGRLIEMVLPGRRHGPMNLDYRQRAGFSAKQLQQLQSGSYQTD